MKNVFRAAKNAPKRYGILAVALAAIVVPASLFAWGPGTRTTYTYENPADHVTFNSMTGTPNYGDERNFVRIKEATASNSTYTDKLDLQPGKEYTAMVYFHNNAASNLNDAAHDHKGIARDTTMRIQMPGVVKNGEEARITGIIKASNATPREVWDEAYGAATQGDMALRYVAGSAKIRSHGAVDGKALPNELFTTGTKIGYDELDGNVPGCNEFAGWVEFNFKAVQPNFEVAKMVSVAGTNDYKESIAVQPGDEVEYKIQYKNTGSVNQNNVYIIDELPKGVEYVKGSTHVATTVTKGQWARINEDTVVNRGISIGSFAPGSNAFVKFKAKVVANDALATCGKNTLVNKVIASTDNGTRTDTATVTVEKDCEETPVTPVETTVEVCALDTKTIITIKESEFDGSKHSTDTADCEEVPVVPETPEQPEAPEVPEQPAPATIEVCELATKNVVLIEPKLFDDSKHSYDLADCEDAPVVPTQPETPEQPTAPEAPAQPTAPEQPTKETPVVELPRTGAGEVMTIGFGIATLIAALGYSAHSRRKLL